MSTLLIRHAECAASFDDARRELRGASVLVSDQLIEAIGPAAELPATARPEQRDQRVYSTSKRKINPLSPNGSQQV